MGNLVAKNVEANFEELCQQLEADDPRRPNGRLQWASPPFTVEEQTRLIHCLSNNKTLQRLVLRDLDTLPDNASLAEALKKHPALAHLCFWGRLPKENFSVFAKAFMGSNSITELEFNTCIIPANTVDGIVSILTASKKITALRLRGCQIEPAELERLTLSLQESVTLLALEITLKPPIASTPSVQYLADMLKSQKAPLQEVNFAGFLTDAVPILAEGGKGHVTLQKLQLQDKAVNDESIASVGEWIGGLPALLKLDLSNCNLTAVGGRILAEVLEESSNNLTLRELYLPHNAFGDDGTVALSKALKRCSNLLVLDLRLNKIGTAGIVALSKSLKDNPALLALRIGEEFVMPGRRFEKEDMKALSNMLLENNVLRKLYMDDASFHEEGMELMAEALTQNRTLQDWNLSCFSSESLRILIDFIPDIHLKKLSVRAHGDLEMDEALGQQLLFNLRKNESLMEFQIAGLKENSESIWKSVQPGVQNILTSRNREAATKRPLDAANPAAATTAGNDDTAKASKTE